MLFTWFDVPSLQFGRGRDHGETWNPVTAGTVHYRLQFGRGRDHGETVGALVTARALSLPSIRPWS